MSVYVFVKSPFISFAIFLLGYFSFSHWYIEIVYVMMLFSKFGNCFLILFMDLHNQINFFIFLLYLE